MTPQGTPKCGSVWIVHEPDDVFLLISLDRFNVVIKYVIF